MDQLTELLNYYSINGIPSLSTNYEQRTKSISRQSSQHSQQHSVRTHHSTGSISSLNNILGGTTSSTTATSQPSSNIGQHIHSLGASFSSTTGIGNVTTAIAAAGIGLPPSLTSINQSNIQTSIKNKAHAPLRNSKSTSSSLMTSQTGQAGGHLESNVQSVKEGKLFLHLLGDFVV